jgi:hypothetical protein
MPAEVVHTSPFVGVVGAVPWGIRRGAKDVVAAGSVAMPVNVNEDPEAAPMLGVINVGLVALTGDPEPVAAVHTGRAEAPPPTRMSVVAPAANV